MPLNIGGNNAGLNSAQLLTFVSAKYGSTFASNAWGRYNSVITSSYVSLGPTPTGSTGEKTTAGDAGTLIALPNIPEFDLLAQFMHTARTCKIAEEIAYYEQHKGGTLEGIKPYLVRPKPSKTALPGPDHLPLETTNFATAMKFADYGVIRIAFGVHDPDNPKAEEQSGAVFPYCGVLQLPIVRSPKAGEENGPFTGALAIQELYYKDIIQKLWASSPLATDFINKATCIVKKKMQDFIDPSCTEISDKDFTQGSLDDIRTAVRTDLQTFIAQQVNDSEWDIGSNLTVKGWAASPVWYNRIAEINGSVTNIVKNIPVPFEYPYVMEQTKTMRTSSAEDNSALSAFDPILPKGARMSYDRHADAQIAPIMYAAYSSWEDRDEIQNAPIIDFVNSLFGTKGLFDMRQNTNVHPLAQLSALGKSMIDASVRNVAVGLPAQMLLQSASSVPGKLGKAAGEFMKTMGLATLSIGFVLFYVVPFLPFIYGMFAVGGWVKSIFEAIVAVPLWALAHIISIDGQGLPGRTASNGYFLIFEIFLRPILILFGVVASTMIYAAMVKVLNEGVFDLVVKNVAGFDQETELAGASGTAAPFYRGPIDQFFFTTMYAIFVYAIGTSSFKLIDQIPKAILRWMGTAVATMNESEKDPAGQITNRAFYGTNLLTGQLEGGALAVIG